ncbi:hypothetical protein LZ30DRAFT_818915 [Colletotrichum cereale]|nr:hypothetical protein LZ30DRAFT_818915 [Colletotrichum cereale]
MENNHITSVHDDFAEDPLSSVGQGTHQANKVIVQFLMERVPEFRELQEGWDNPQGDQYFHRQRHRADRANARTARFFYHMMQQIGKELHRAVGAFAIQNDSLTQPMILDMCMAPGGFLATALELNPRAHAVGFNMGVTEVPVGHPDHGEFLPQQLKPDDLFDLVICDGQVLRTHFRADYRERRESRRLILTQLSLGLEHTRPGGTMVVLLHKLEAWDTVLLLHVFGKFATVRLFKPRVSHAKRSSFYLVARDIQSQQTAAAHAIGNWKSIWKAATLGTEEEYWKTIRKAEPSVEELLGEFGSELIRLGKDIWATQARALAKAPFIKQQS